MSVMSNRDLIDASTLSQDKTIEADVVIVGTGAGGGYSAEILTMAGLKVVMVEEGAYHTAKTFSQNEAVATAMLYQQAGAQKTKDQGIVVMQGRNVGGGTTVNWTTSIRTPEPTLKHWRDRFGLSMFTSDALAPFFAEAEARFDMHVFDEFPPNANNQILSRACAAKGYEWHVIARNVKGCVNSGLCGLGCPINAKRSQLVTTIPSALDKGATLIFKARADKLVQDGTRISALEVTALDRAGLRASGHKITVKAKHFVISAGAIRSPALLMRSGIPDPSKMLGKRTFLHPVTAVSAVFDQAIDGFYGAPQTINSHEFMFRDPYSEHFGFKLETLPVSALVASTFVDKSIGKAHADRMRALPNLGVLVALCADGFNDFEPCGTVEAGTDGHVSLDYKISDFLQKSARNALEHLMDLQFTAGAKTASPWHMDNPVFRSMDAGMAWLREADLGLLKGGYGSAHVMGGCQMGIDEGAGVVDAYGRHFVIENLSVHDASIFPTSIGVNPQLSIYATSLRNSKALAVALV